MFNKNITKLANLGISLTALFESNIFCYAFENEQWPAISSDDRSLSVAYNGSKFQLNNQYDELFEKFDIPRIQNEMLVDSLLP